MSEEASRIGSGGATSSGQPSERTPDFIPGWFIPRPGNVDTAEREAVRFIGTQDFPINFLRDGEAVWLPKPPQVGVCIGQRASDFCLGVPPGYWIVRDSDGRPQLWREEDFEKKWVRNNGRDWISPAERLRDNPHLTDEQRAEYEDRLDQLRYVDGWQGTPPAEGTRRKLIFDVIDRFAHRLISGHGGKQTPNATLDLADAIETALLKIDIGADPTGEVSPASTVMDVLDGLRIDRTRDGAILDIGQRVTELADKFVQQRREATDVDRLNAIAEERWKRIGELEDQLEEVRESLDLIDAPAGPSFAKRIGRLFRELTGRAPGYGTAVEGKIKPGTRELRIVLENISPRDQPPEYRFIELEDQDGRGMGAFKVRPSDTKPFVEVAIPYARDDAWVSEVAHQAGGAVSGVFLREDPTKVMPAEECAAAVAEILMSFGVKALGDHDVAEEQLEHGRKEARPGELREYDPDKEEPPTFDEAPGGDDPAATIEFLEGEVERLLGGREEARTGESRFAEERDCAFALLRWLLPVTVAKRLD